MDEKILKRLEYEKKAQKIIERLAEETVNLATFNTLATLIEPYHYEEIVEERFLAQICGHPICSNLLKDIPKQKYQISMKYNKVYDITYRKKFCSNNCYLSSNVLKSKISTVPIWSRDTPIPKPIVQYDKYELESLERNKTCLERDEEVIAKSKLSSTDIENELKAIEREWKMRADVIAQKNLADQLPLKDPRVVEKQNETPLIIKTSEIKIEIDVESEKEADFMNLEKILGAEQLRNANRNQIKLIEKVLNALFVSFTRETRLLLKFGGESGKNDAKTEEIEVEISKMSLNEIKDEKKVDLSATINDSVLETKLRNFFNPQQWKKEFGDEKKVRFEGVDGADEMPKNEEVVVYPLVDEYCQLQIRQQLFCEKVTKNLDSIFRKSTSEVGLRIGDMKKELKAFTTTLNLTNMSFNFRPEEWILVAIIMLNLLRAEDEMLISSIEQDKYYLALVNSFGLNIDMLQQILQFMIFS